MLQVEELNTAARQLYEGLGYESVAREEAASVLRLQPGNSGLASALMIADADVLANVECAVVTMAKQVAPCSHAPTL